MTLRPRSRRDRVASIGVLLAAACASIFFTSPADAQPYMRVRSTTPKETLVKDGKPKFMVGYQLRTGAPLAPTRRWKDERQTVNVGGPTQEQIWRDTAEADGWLEREDKPAPKPNTPPAPAKRGDYTKTFALTLTDFSEWLDLAKLNLPAAQGTRAGGKGEWPMIWIYFDGPRDGVAFEVQLAEKPEESAVVATFTERSASGTIGFTLPLPLAANKAEIETGSAMVARQLEWAKQLSRNKEPNVGRFEVWVSMAGLYYDPGLAVPCVDTIRKLGGNVLTGAPLSSIQEVGLRTVRNSDTYMADVEAGLAAWQEFARGPLASELNTADGTWLREHLAAFTIGGDGSSTFGVGDPSGLRALDFKGVDAGKVNGWYREFLKSSNVTADQLGSDPAAAVYTPFSFEGDLAKRKAVYFSARFAQFLSAKHLRAVTDGIRTSVPGVRTIAMMSQRAMLGAKEGFGSAAGNLDPFVLAAQSSVTLLGTTDQLSVSLGDAESNFSGAGTFEFVQAVLRSASLDRDVRVHTQFAPSDEKEIYTKGLAALAQGAKTFHFRDFGPTLAAKNEYWSDYSTMYDGVSRFTDLLERNEESLFTAKTVTDPVAIVYSASSDIWAGDDGSAFSDMRLTWHALRHMGYQPNFVSEAQVESGGLKNYKVVHVSGKCLSKKAGEALSAWVNEGGVAMFAGGAATRDEFNEPLLPECAKTLVAPVAGSAKRMSGRYNERTDLPAMKPVGNVMFSGGKAPMEMPVIAVKTELAAAANAVKLATFPDGAPAAASVAVGKGQVIACGFLPGLAYGHGAGFKAKTSDEKWPDAPRLLIKLAVDAAKIVPVTKIEPDGSGVTASLISSQSGPVLVIVNPAGRTMARLRVDVKANFKMSPCMSFDGARVTIRRGEGTAMAVELPLRGGSEIILLPR